MCAMKRQERMPLLQKLRIVKGMPKWSPALAGGKPADSNYTLYIPFRPQLYRKNK